MSSGTTTFELLSESPEQTRAWAAALARCLVGGDVVALVGQLGVGKTQWVKGLAAGLGIDPDEVHSPTFTLINEYESPAGFMLYHVDAYRLDGPEEMEAIGFEEMITRGDGVTAVEWADRIETLIPPAAITITGSLPPDGDPQHRLYRITAPRTDLRAQLLQYVPPIE